MIVALDGPAGAGKSTLAKRVSSELGFQLVETGALYRAVGLLAREQGVSLDNAAGLEALATDLPLRFVFEGGCNHVWLGDRDVTELLRTEQAGADASVVSSVPEVRAALLSLQRELAAASDSVLEGRDIGTVVCPSAEVKFYITASPEMRATRRVAELLSKSVVADYEQVLSDIIERDERDMNREIAPLRPADDAIYLDTTERPIEDVFALVRDEIHRVRNEQR